MIFKLIFQISLCLVTLGTVIPTVLLGLKIPPADRPAFFRFSGFLSGAIFVVASIFSGPVFSSLWGMHAWISMAMLLGIFFYINYYLSFSSGKALWINFFMQLLLISAIPMTNLTSNDVSISERTILYISLIISFSFVIYNSSLLLLPYASVKRIYDNGVYIFIVIMLLIGLEPFTKTNIFIELTRVLSISTGFYPVISIFINLVAIPLIGFIPFFAIKHLCKVPPGMDVNIKESPLPIKFN